MYFKDQRYEKTKALSLATTYTKQLPESGLLDNIDLFFKIVNASSVVNGAPMNIHHHITKIEVLGNTDKVLLSMTGEEAIAKAYRKMRAMPQNLRTEIGGVTQSQTIPLFFGRKPYDGEYALDLSKWDKVELSITNDFSSTYFGSHTVDIKLATIEDAATAPPKFMKQWEYEKEKPAADTGYVRPKLPTSGLLRSLMVQLDPDLTASTAAPVADPISDSYNWKLFFKDRALTIVDARPKDLFFKEHSRIGFGVSSVKPYSSITQYTDYDWAYIISQAIAPIENTTLVVPNSLEGSNNRYHVFKTVGSDIQDDVIVTGCGLFHTFEIPFYLPKDEETNYLDLATYKPIEIEWYGFKDDNTHRVILEKPVPQGPGEFA
jgi:hypothetical protein